MDRTGAKNARRTTVVDRTGAKPWCDRFWEGGIMQLVPGRILACPICGAFAKTLTLISGNTFGAVHFTDGSMIAMSLPDVPRITRCKNCGSLYWLDDEKAVWDPWGGVPVDPEIRERAERVEPPSANDFAEAL